MKSIEYATKEVRKRFSTVSLFCFPGLASGVGFLFDFLKEKSMLGRMNQKS